MQHECCALKSERLSHYYIEENGKNMFSPVGILPLQKQKRVGRYKCHQHMMNGKKKGVYAEFIGFNAWQLKYYNVKIWQKLLN